MQPTPPSPETPGGLPPETLAGPAPEQTVAHHGLRGVISGMRERWAGRREGQAEAHESDAAFYDALRADAARVLAGRHDPEGDWLSYNPREVEPDLAAIQAANANKDPDMPGKPGRVSPLKGQADSHKLMREMDEGRYQVNVVTGEKRFIPPAKVRADYLNPPKHQPQVLSPTKEDPDKPDAVIRPAAQTPQQKQAEVSLHGALDKIVNERAAQQYRFKMFGGAHETNIRETRKMRDRRRRSDRRDFTNGLIDADELARREEATARSVDGRHPHAIHKGEKRLKRTERKVGRVLSSMPEAEAARPVEPKPKRRTVQPTRRPAASRRVKKY